MIYWLSVVLALGTVVKSHRPSDPFRTTALSVTTFSVHGARGRSVGDDPKSPPETRSAVLRLLTTVVVTPEFKSTIGGAFKSVIVDCALATAANWSLVWMLMTRAPIVSDVVAKRTRASAA